MPAKQHDDHCIMNVNWEPWRIQWIHNGQMCVAHNGVTRVADMSKIDWVEYCRVAYEHYQAEKEQKAAYAARKYYPPVPPLPPPPSRGRPRYFDHNGKVLTYFRSPFTDWCEHVDTGESLCFATANELQDEVVNPDHEFFDVVPIVEVLLERRLR